MGSRMSHSCFGKNILLHNWASLNNQLTFKWYIRWKAWQLKKFQTIFKFVLELTSFLQLNLKLICADFLSRAFFVKFSTIIL